MGESERIFLYPYLGAFSALDIRLPAPPWVTVSADCGVTVAQLEKQFVHAAARVAMERWSDIQGPSVDLWQQRAGRLVRAGKLPLPSDYSRDEQIRRLAGLRWEHALWVVIVCPRIVIESETAPDDVATVVDASRWLVSRTKASVIIGLPDDLTLRPDEQCLEKWRNFGSVLIVDWTSGQPHPLSASEGKHALALRSDTELGSLFMFNQLVEISSSSHPRVDLLWQEGRLVVEIDSFAVHGGASGFRSDRQRDFELLAAGYVVLRLTEEEVLQDVGRALTKIRILVDQRRKQTNHGA